MIKILTLSDIHNNISAIQSLRDQETNEYDAIVIAGDVGNYIWPEALAIIDTFNCPAYFVYGNWDNRQPYIRNLSNNSILLNNAIEFHNGYYFTGFGGCDTHWGMNPFFMEQVALIKEAYRVVIEAHENERELIAKKQADEKIKRDILINAINGAYLKNRRQIKKAVNKKDIKRFNNEVLELKKWKETELNKIAFQRVGFTISNEYKKYKQEIYTAHNNTLLMNRNKLLSTIRQANIPDNRLIIVSHDRLTKLTEEKIPTFLHLFGHRHDYKLTKMGSSHYLNTAQLDSSIGIGGRLGGGYCIVKMNGNSIIVERRTLPFQLGCKPGSSYI